MNRKLRILLIAALALCLALCLSACGKKRPVVLVKMEIEQAEEGTLTADRTQLKEVGEITNFTLQPKPGYIPYAVNFFDENGQIVTASYYIENYEEEGLIHLEEDGSYALHFDVGLYFDINAEHEAEGELPEETVKVKVLPQFISLDLPEVTLEEQLPHSLVTIFPAHAKKGEKISIVISTERGYKVTSCSHNGIEFPVEEPFQSYDDATHHYVSFIFYMKEEDEVVRYTIGESEED